ncbi:MAG: hypothetical protein HYS27_25440 [Deltaproteobacteria bacterium]|nr:hypothetical protein [Deltaproteobacteria bacterium]
MITALSAPEPLAALLGVARDLRDSGASQADVEALFREFLATPHCQGEREDDLVRDALDFIVGFCAPNMRLFR